MDQTVYSLILDGFLNSVQIYHVFLITLGVAAGICVGGSAGADGDHGRGPAGARNLWHDP